MAVGDSEDEVLGTAFLRRLRERGLSGVRLVISDAHSGLKRAISRTLAGATPQRCRVHLMRNLQALAPKAHAEMVGATVRTIFSDDQSVIRLVGAVPAGPKDATWDPARLEWRPAPPAEGPATEPAERRQSREPGRRHRQVQGGAQRPGRVRKVHDAAPMSSMSPI